MTNISALPDLLINDDKRNSKFNRLKSRYPLLYNTIKNYYFNPNTPWVMEWNNSAPQGSLYLIYSRTTFACQGEPG